MNQNVATSAPFLVFTDLDGSLMEHESYSIEAAKPALVELARRGVTPIFASSKTAVEILAVQRASGITAPFICENGAAVYDSSGQIQTAFGLPRTNWLHAVHQLRKRLSLRFTGFSDWPAEKIAELTGLSRTDAEKAQRREFTEPMLWQDTQANFQLFQSEIQRLSLTTLEGGRFLSIQSQFGKGKAMKWLQARQGHPRPFLIALGDSPNDLSLLAAADVAVVIKSGKSDHLHPQGPATVIRTSIAGPAGWNDGIKQILNLLDSQQLLIN
ncbi:MAG: HAD-IIB family hydrolase [Pseudomonadota bacterium]|nr:HAD-IIB family hydrolase [Pseudomonadota bacterium]MEC8472070.1 HAD-IIB family hydrolase [Pseudomonadota bacterium]